MVTRLVVNWKDCFGSDMESGFQELGVGVPCQPVGVPLVQSENDNGIGYRGESEWGGGQLGVRTHRI